MATSPLPLEARVGELSHRISRLENRAHNELAVIQTFEPEPYELLRPITVAIREDGDGYMATFYDANISTAGDTEQEAFENLKSLILDVFDSLAREQPERLGPEPQRQMAVLRSFLRAA